VLWSCFLKQVQLKKCNEDFDKEFDQWEAPSPNAAHQWVKQWCEKGSNN
jgi:hypothetical protein